MRILRRVPDSVLFLYADIKTIESNLRTAAAAAGVDPARLVFRAALAHAEYLARYQTLDLYLDTLPYNAGTTASDALWMGLPIMTLPGETLASRVAASVLTAAELPELVVASQEHYERLAEQLASNPAFYTRVKQRVMQSRSATLLEPDRFTRHLERGYRAIHLRQLTGRRPADTVVALE
jgi:predicted O-linked N-acetylglucosamine transferase (SPINDLY family)